MSSYDPTQNISVDEAMIAFKGRLSIKQYMPKKPVKRGINVWMRSDSKNGYVSQFSVYTGKKGDTTEFGLGGNAVNELVEGAKGKYLCIFMDDLFSSVPLFLQLLSEKTYACSI